MGLRINTNVSSLTAQRNMGQNTTNLQQSFERLSSGYRINRSADDAAGLAVSENIRGKVRAMSQAKRNANDAVSLVQIAEGGMNEMSNIFIRLRELTVQSASDTISDNERGFLNKEYTQLVDEVDRIANTTEFNSVKLFKSDAKSQFVIQVGANGSAPEENMDTISINLEGLHFGSEDLQLGKGSEIGPSVLGEEGPSRDEIAGRLGVLDNALQKIAGERATLGSIQSRLGSAVSNLGTSIENQTTAMSRIKDTDFAEETSKLTQAKILSQASLSVLAQANAAPEMALALLRN